MRSMVAAREWTGAVGNYLENRQRFFGWRHITTLALSAALSGVDESDALDTILNDVWDMEENDDVVYRACIASIDVCSAQKIESRLSVREVLRGDWRDMWIGALGAREKWKAIIEVLSGVSGEAMTASERRHYSWSLVQQRKYEKAGQFLKQWPDARSQFLLARKHRGSAAFTLQAHKLLNSENLELQRWAKKRLSGLGIPMWKFYIDPPDKPISLKLVLFFILLVVTMPIILLGAPFAWIYRRLVAAFKFVWRFVVVRVP